MEEDARELRSGEHRIFSNDEINPLFREGSMFPRLVGLFDDGFVGLVEGGIEFGTGTILYQFYVCLLSKSLFLHQRYSHE